MESTLNNVESSVNTVSAQVGVVQQTEDDQLTLQNPAGPHRTGRHATRRRVRGAGQRRRDPRLDADRGPRSGDQRPRRGAGGRHARQPGGEPGPDRRQRRPRGGQRQGRLRRLPRRRTSRWRSERCAGRRGGRRRCRRETGPTATSAASKGPRHGRGRLRRGGRRGRRPAGVGQRRDRTGVDAGDTRRAGNAAPGRRSPPASGSTGAGAAGSSDPAAQVLAPAPPGFAQQLTGLYDEIHQAISTLGLPRQRGRRRGVVTLDGGLHPDGGPAERRRPVRPVRRHTQAVRLDVAPAHVRAARDGRRRRPGRRERPRQGGAQARPGRVRAGRVVDRQGEGEHDDVPGAPDESRRRATRRPAHRRVPRPPPWPSSRRRRSPSLRPARVAAFRTRRSRTCPRTRWARPTRRSPAPASARPRPRSRGHLLGAGSDRRLNETVAGCPPRSAVMVAGAHPNSPTPPASCSRWWPTPRRSSSTINYLATVEHDCDCRHQASTTSRTSTTPPSTPTTS